MAESGKQGRRWLGNANLDQTFLAGGVASAVWVIILVLLWWLTPGGEAGETRAGGTRFATLMAALLPFALIWFAVFTARALVGLRDEAHSLRAELLVLREAVPGRPKAAEPDDVPPQPILTPPRQPAPAPVAAGGTAARATPKRADAPQSSLDLDGPKAVEVPVDDLIAALNFPDGPDDHVAIEALRRALADGETQRLIRAAQDVVTLLAGHGLYMDDLRAAPAPADIWRRLAEGQRGPALAEAAVVLPDDETRVALVELLRGEEVFRDAAHYFLRRWDRMLVREAPKMTDPQIERLAATRSGRAFAALAQATGMLG